MTDIVIACAVALAVTALAVTAFLLGRRSRGSADERVAAAVAQLDERMQAMVGGLADALERAQEENRRSRLLGELGGTIDLDVVLTRTLEAAAALDGVDAAVVRVEIDGAEPLMATRGLHDGEPVPTPTEPPEGEGFRPIAVELQDEDETEGDPIRAGLAIPLTCEGDRLGDLTAYSRQGASAFGEAVISGLEELALRAGPAIDNARRYREARQLADLDALTGLHNRRYFYETLAREVARAHRYARNLALVVLDLDDFKAINDRIGHLAGDAVLAEAADRIRDVLRSADVACRVGGDEFAVILPESGIDDADQLYRRLGHAVFAKPVGRAGRLHLSAGVTELRPDDDAVAFFERADAALYRAKGAGKGSVVAVAARPEPGEGSLPRSVERN